MKKKRIDIDEVREQLFSKSYQTPEDLIGMGMLDDIKIFEEVYQESMSNLSLADAHLPIRDDTTFKRFAGFNSTRAMLSNRFLSI